MLASFDTPDTTAETLTRAAHSHLEAGRFLAVREAHDHTWSPRAAHEAQLVQALCGAPEARRTTRDDTSDTHATFHFFAHLGLRIYDSDEPVRASGEHTILLFRRAGPLARDRRHTLPEAERTANRLAIEDPAFTRDQANSMWHLAADNWHAQLATRLARLLCWRDECVAVLEAGVWRVRAAHSFSADPSLVPVAEAAPEPAHTA